MLSESQTLLLGMHADWHMLRLLPPKHPHFVCPDLGPGTYTKADFTQAQKLQEDMQNMLAT